MTASPKLKEWTMPPEPAYALLTASRAAHAAHAAPDASELAALAVSGLPSPHSRRIYTSHITRYLEAGHQLTRESLQSHLERLRASGMGSSGRNHALSAVRLLAREAHVRGLLSDAALHAIEAIQSAPRRGVRTGNWLELAEIRTMIDTAQQGRYGTRNAALIAILAGCGLRREEIASLEWSQWVKRSNRRVWLDIHGKGDRTRTVPCPAWVAAYVQAWQTEQASGTASGDSGKVIDVGPQAVYYIVQDVARRAGVPRLAPHDLRRSYARLSREGGASLEQIQTTLGHSSIATTQRYLGTQLELREGHACGDHIHLPDRPGD